MNFLVTGASGFVGQKVVRNLLDRPGTHLTYLGRKQGPELPSSAVFRQWSGKGEPDLSGLAAPNVVIHLAGEPIAQRWSPAVKQAIYNSRVEGTKNLVNALEKTGARPALVAASAIGYYGDRGDEVLTESSSAGDDFLAEVCVGWEREAGRARAFGCRVVSIRIATVLGMDGGALPKMLPPFRMGLGAKLGDGQQWMSWIHIDDLVQLILFAADHEGLRAVVNGSSPDPVTNAAFTRELGNTLHRPALLAAPKFILRAALGEMSEFLFSSLRVIPQATEKAGFVFQYRTLGSALRSLLDAR